MKKKISKHKSVTVLIVFRPAEKALLALTAHHCTKLFTCCEVFSQGYYYFYLGKGSGYFF